MKKKLIGVYRRRWVRSLESLRPVVFYNWTGSVIVTAGPLVVVLGGHYDLTGTFDEALR